MKNLLILSMLLFATVTYAQQGLNFLRFDDQKYFYNKPAGERSWSFTVDIKVPAVEVIASENTFRTEKIRSGIRSTRNFGIGKPVRIVVVPLLYEVQKNNTTTVFKFGQNGGENRSVNSAEVTVSQSSGGSTSGTAGRLVNPPVRVNIIGSDFYRYPGNGVRNNKDYLYVNASENNPVTLSIEREEKRGKVYVCIFDSNGNLLKALDPKDPSENPGALSYTTKQSVYVIPVIGASIEDANNVTFEVGDPREIATIEIIEE